MKNCCLASLMLRNLSSKDRRPSPPAIFVHLLLLYLEYLFIVALEFAQTLLVYYREILQFSMTYSIQVVAGDAVYSEVSVHFSTLD